MGWFYFDFHCEPCDEVFEAMVNSNADDVTEPCQTCGEPAKKVLGCANLGWSNNPQIRSEMLRKRSTEHTKNEQKKGNMLSPKDLIGK